MPAIWKCTSSSTSFMCSNMCGVRPGASSPRFDPWAEPRVGGHALAILQGAAEHVADALEQQADAEQLSEHKRVFEVERCASTGPLMIRHGRRWSR
ncbi:hypothetical protein AB0K74_34670 [Streptomyces sp. NPDC056159]|uniref:hypothetical protein n=1 Tax=unclassified Streptomyces TaxID=2593676 RepID=UPI003419C804